MTEADVLTLSVVWLDRGGNWRRRNDQSMAPSSTPRGPWISLKLPYLPYGVVYITLCTYSVPVLLPDEDAEYHNKRSCNHPAFYSEPRKTLHLNW